MSEVQQVEEAGLSMSEVQEDGEWLELFHLRHWLHKVHEFWP
jgi:hypothetical protein